jgi:ABC-2 type transport system permease protein
MSEVVAFVKRDWRIARTYRAAFVGQLAGVLVFLATFGLLSPVVRDDFAGRFGMSYFGFAAVGIAVSGILVGTMSAFSGALREAQLDGTLEAILLAPISHVRLVALLGVWPLLFGFVAGGATLLVAGLAGATFSVQWEALVVVALLSVVAFAGLGLIAAAAVLVVKRGDPVAALVGMVGTLAGGAYVPTSTFPGWLRGVAAVNPMTAALDAWRGALLGGSSAGLAGPVLGLAALAAVAVPFGWWLCGRAVDVARRDGTLAAY